MTVQVWSSGAGMFEECRGAVAVLQVDLQNVWL